MNDYWNDPPEDFEPPECCDEIMDMDKSGACLCLTCGKRIEPQEDIQPEPDIDFSPEILNNSNKKCPHNKDYEDCDYCLHASDLAYDSARERC